MIDLDYLPVLRFLMIDKLSAFTAAYLHQRLDYNPVSGVLVWNAKPGLDAESRRWNARYAGTRAGAPSVEGYVRVRIDGTSFAAHHIMWKMTFTEDVEDELDHIDRNKRNNRIINLRAATSMQNSWNQTRRCDNSSGTTGVIWIARLCKWQASIMANGENRVLGCFEDYPDAVAARRTAEREQYGTFSP